MQKTVSGILLFLLLANTLNLTFNIKRAKADGGTIYIRADGSVYPSDAPISSVDNVTYTFTDNINDSIIVERDDIAVDGASFIVQGTEATGSVGIDLSKRNNVTIKNTNIKSFNHGIYLDSSSNNTMVGNNITNNNLAGIYLLEESSNNSIVGNNITNNTYGICLDSSSNNTMVGNNITNNNLAGIYLLEESSNNSIVGNNITENNWIGIALYSSSNNKFHHNNFIDNTHNAYSGSSNNLWNSPQPITYIYNGSEYVNYLGNYWSDYSGTDINNDGIGDTSYNINSEKDYYPLIQPFETYFQVPSTTELVMNEITSSTHALTETILGQTATLDTSITGDFNAVLNFSNFEIVLIDSGSFAGKGFSKGNWSANIEGNPYEGSWQGMLFKKPEERKIYLKGMVSGDLKGIAEGFLSESVNGSNIYDQYQTTWTISHIGADIVFAKLNLNGTINYQESVEYSSELYALQTFIQGEASGYYDGSLSVVLTHVRIDNATNPYYGQGFSLISYVIEFGSGEGWTCDKITSPEVEMNGLFTGSLTGIVSGRLESQSSRTLSLSIERINIGLPPMADLKIIISGPERVSPGQTINYVLEYRNDGLKTAEDAVIFSFLDPLIYFSSASSGAEYDEFTHSVSWYLGKVPPQTTRSLSLQAKIPWGLSQGTTLVASAYIVDREGSAGSQDLQNLFVNGIGLKFGSHGAIQYENFARNQKALWVPVYYSGLASDVLGVIDAALGNPSNNNGLTQPMITQHHYDTVYAYSGGTRTVLSAMRFYNLTCEKLVLISPMSLQDLDSYENELNESLQTEKVKEIEVYQSAKDKLPFGDIYQAYFDLNDPDTWDWLDGKKITVHEIALPSKAGVGAHWELFIAVNGKLQGKDRSSSMVSVVATAHDPNIKYGPEGYVSLGQKLDYKVQYENEGEGIAFGVYFTDTLDEDLNASTLEIGPVFSTKNGSVIAGPGIYNPSTRTITWFVGEVGPSEGGFANFSANVRNDAPEYTEIINYATVYFPSVPETTRTNAIVSIVGQPNIAVTNITSPGSMIEKGSTLNINVTVANEGYYPETFNLTLYANTTTIQTQSITLLGRNSDTRAFLWNTTCFAKGNYTISAYAWPVPDEVKTDDNLYVGYTCQYHVIPEFPSFLIMPLFIIVTMLIAILYKRRRPP